MPVIDVLQQVNASSPFNAWAGFELVFAGNGAAELVVNLRSDLLQHSGFLHAAVVGGLIDTACGFAAATVAGNVLASQYQVMCYAPAIGDRFIARAKVPKAGKRKVLQLRSCTRIAAARRSLWQADRPCSWWRDTGRRARGRVPDLRFPPEADIGA
jgi:acyl-coenzyme A thioesterase PaaI-like protein